VWFRAPVIPRLFDIDSLSRKSCMLCCVCNFTGLWILQETTLFLQMLCNLNFKQQYSEELTKHYPMMIESVVNRNSTEPRFVTQFKALDSSLDRGVLTSIEVADGNDKEVVFHIFRQLPMILCVLANPHCGLCLLQLCRNFLVFSILSWLRARTCWIYL